MTNGSFFMYLNGLLVFSPLARIPLLYYQVLSINQRLSPDKMLFRNHPEGWQYWHPISCLYFAFKPPNIHANDSVLHLGWTNSRRSPKVKKKSLHLRHKQFCIKERSFWYSSAILIQAKIALYILKEPKN